MIPLWNAWDLKNKILNGEYYDKTIYDETIDIRSYKDV